MPELSPSDIANKFFQMAHSLPDKYIFPVAALISIFALAQNNIQLPPEYMNLVQLMGGAALGNVFAKFSRRENVSPDELRAAVEEIYEAPQFQDLLKKTDFSEELLQRTTELGKVIGTALHIAEDSIVKRILGATAAQHDVSTTRIVEAFNQIPDLLTKLDPETRYLVRKIEEWEGSQDGILEKFVELKFEVNSLYASTPIIRGEKRRLRHKSLSKISIHFQPPPTDSEAKGQTTLEDIRDAVQSYSRFMLTGEPGSGKTTTLYQIAIETAWKRISDRSSPIPVLLSLTSWATEQSPVDFIRSKWELASIDLEVGLLRGEVLLLLDGLNETGADSVKKVEQLAGWIAEYNSPQRLIVSCRKSDYELFVRSLKGRPVNLALPEIGLQPLSKEQIANMAVNYLGEKANTFLNRIFPEYSLPTATSELSTIAQNPFMLAALIYIFEDVQELPTNPAKILQVLTVRLWEREKEFVAGWIPLEQIEPILANIAFDIIQNGLPNAFSNDFAQTKGLSDSLVRVAQGASLLRTDDDAIKFYHPLFLEYFGAVFMRRSRRLPPLKTISPELLHQQIFNNPRLARGQIVTIGGVRAELNTRWQRSIVMLIGILPEEEIERVLDTLIGLDIWIAGMCLASNAYQDEKRFDIVIDKLIKVGELIEFPDTLFVFADMMKSLGAAANPHLLKIIEQIGEKNRIRGAAVDTLMMINGKRAIPILEALFRKAFGSQDISLEASTLSNLMILWDKQLEQVTLFDGFNLKRITQNVQTRANVEFAWKYQPSATLSVRRLEFWLSKLEATKLIMQITIRIG